MVSSNTTKIQLSLRAEKLQNVSLSGFINGVSDPYAIVSVYDPFDAINEEEIGRTETIKNNLSPSWSKIIYIDWTFGKPLYFKVAIYDEGKNNDILMGKCDFDVNDIISSEGNTKAKVLKERGGTIYAFVEENTNCDDNLCFQLRAFELKRDKGWFSAPNPYYTISRKDPIEEQWTLIYRSDHVLDNPCPVWNKVRLSMSALCNGDANRPLKIQVFDFRKKSKHAVIGQAETSVNKILKIGSHSQSNASKDLVLLKGNVKSGHMTILDALIELSQDSSTSYYSGDEQRDEPPNISKQEKPPPADNIEPTFFNYLSGGCQICLCVAIDFTATNGNPRNPRSLHYISGNGEFNAYEKAIHAVGSILIKYDSDHKVPVWGFGVRLNGETNNCFQCGRNVEVFGVDGILGAYRSVFQTPIVMSEPTDWSSSILNAATYATAAERKSYLPDAQVYSVLLIISDGGVEDMKKTLDALNEAKSSPLSVVVVGVGGADFREFKKLLGDQENDNTTFVDFHEHTGNMSSLSRAALSKVPRQLEKYFTKRDILPLQLSDVSEVRKLGDDFGSMTMPAPAPLPPSGEPFTDPVQPPKYFIIEIPDGVREGYTLQVKSPINGKLFEIVVPEGVMSGGHMKVEI
mmetsp:Transcript_41422/g.97040  ORF Transcript_41422/g.97040 Transcript_41422/m.97040 type:complete len:631 (-) Transcript_41422:1101-2993(-)|eukprot:CAMPEP_0113310940 /NCGR_PEP_ID=MMETSP0010_2-20120614/8384_1 /TAXON_ID=216773 ORGANISM="Corethron hystrix, Strain 308" /NCGR_SAMPLE_ID=MMETSP0010_2 /ASSEMBLY_ACC=CAM_ASM_000155 /LENGTH=630 /DNA_ID=CAMNT_0000166495 /DNA_START=142 /DNA_END=2034 /DNA_ORIENTATION=- /assembly_acc=CAM_ASM_000155